MAADSKTPTWGIEPVPDRLHVLGFFDTAALWSSLGVSLLVLVADAWRRRARRNLGAEEPSLEEVRHG